MKKIVLAFLAVLALWALPAAAQLIAGNASVSSTSPTAARVALPVSPGAAPYALIVPAPGTTAAVYYKFGGSSVAATTSSPVLPLGGICVAAGGQNTNLSILASTGSATVNVTQLSQCPFFAGG